MTTENILITSGSQQALDLLGKIFINAGDRILVESPTYLGALQAWNAYGAEYVTVPSDENGMITEATGSSPAFGPKVHLRAAQFPEPDRCDHSHWSAACKLVELADRYGVPIIEDDPYGQLRFEGEHIPAVDCWTAKCAA